MNFGIYSYTATILIFCGLALLLYIIGRLLRKKSAMLPASDWKVIIWTIIIFAIITGPEEYVALAWRTWTYNPERTFNTTFLGAEVETYLFITLVALVVSIATLVYARREDRKRNSVLWLLVLCMLCMLEFVFRQRKTWNCQRARRSRTFCPATPEPRSARRGQNSVRAIFKIHRQKTKSDFRAEIGSRRRRDTNAFPPPNPESKRVFHAPRPSLQYKHTCNISHYCHRTQYLAIIHLWIWKPQHSNLVKTSSVYASKRIWRKATFAARSGLIVLKWAILRPVKAIPLLPPLRKSLKRWEYQATSFWNNYEKKIFK